MQELLRIAIEVVVFLLMLAVGLDCTASGFHQSATRSRLIVTVTLAQFLCIPVIALAVVSLLGLPPGLSAGLLLISACPSGTISNTYTFLARGNSTLSVTLTTLSCLAAFAATPTVLFLLDSLAGKELKGTLTLPWQPLAKQLLISMALPVAMGLALRHRFPKRIEPLLNAARSLSAALVLALVALIVLTNPSEMGRQLQQIWTPALVITGCLFLLAGVVAVGFRLPKADRIAVFFELPCRNLAIAALLGMSVLKRPELVYRATAFFLVEAMVLLLIAGFLSVQLRRSSGWKAGGG